MFSALSRSHGELRWDESTGFTGSTPMMEIVQAFIESGEYVTNPVWNASAPPSGDSPEWLAWLTARSALEDSAVEAAWSPEPPLPPGLFEVPTDAVS